LAPIPPLRERVVEDEESLLNIIKSNYGRQVKFVFLEKKKPMVYKSLLL
jgi:transcriptional regulator with AAA-type ATPase domain